MDDRRFVVAWTNPLTKEIHRGTLVMSKGDAQREVNALNCQWPEIVYRVEEVEK